MNQLISADRSATNAPLDEVSCALFMEQLQREAKRHDPERHPFHLRMLDGALSSDEIRLWVVSAYHFEARTPIADALILAKSEDSAFRRRWLQRMLDRDAESEEAGGFSAWRRFADVLGVNQEILEDPSAVVSGVRFASDAYVGWVRDSTLTEAVAASLVDLLATDGVMRRLNALDSLYPWIDPRALEPLRTRIARSRKEADQALAFLARHAVSPSEREGCSRALVQKALILWHLLDCIELAAQNSGKFL